MAACAQAMSVTESAKFGLCHISLDWNGHRALCGALLNQEDWCCARGYPKCGRPPCEECEMLADKRAWETRFRAPL